MLINGKMDKLWSIHRWGRLYSSAVNHLKFCLRRERSQTQKRTSWMIVFASSTKAGKTN